MAPGRHRAGGCAAVSSVAGDDRMTRPWGVFLGTGLMERRPMGGAAHLSAAIADRDDVSVSGRGRGRWASLAL